MCAPDCVRTVRGAKAHRDKPCTAERTCLLAPAVVRLCEERSEMTSRPVQMRTPRSLGARCCKHLLGEWSGEIGADEDGELAQR